VSEIVPHAPLAPSVGPEADPRSLATRQRLLETAGEHFGERGFAGATIREICKQAEANIAAVHYHFGDKAGLYAATLAHAREQSGPRVMGAAPGEMTWQQLSALPPGVRLHEFLLAMLRRVLDKGKPHWHTQLWLHEMVNPTRELDNVVDSSIRPQWEGLRAIVRELTGLPDSDERVWLSTCSIVAQVLLYKHGSAVMARLYAGSPAQAFSPDRPLHEHELRLLAQHICSFSLGGLARLRADRQDARLVNETTPSPTDPSTHQSKEHPC
jgi:TetR/AcrR family transcriptional regulator, regulator of cefoperazone and chloramphenicol sensitivity